MERPSPEIQKRQGFTRRSAVLSAIAVVILAVVLTAFVAFIWTQMEQSTDPEVQQNVTEIRSNLRSIEESFAEIWQAIISPSAPTPTPAP